MQAVPMFVVAEGAVSAVLVGRYQFVNKIVK